MNTEGVKPENPELKEIISLCNLYLTELLHYFISNCNDSTLSEIIEIAREYGQWTRFEFVKKDTMNTLTIGSNNQNQTIDSKLNINRNNLRRLLHQSTFSKMRMQ